MTFSDDINMDTHWCFGFRLSGSLLVTESVNTEAQAQAQVNDDIRADGELEKFDSVSTFYLSSKMSQKILTLSAFQLLYEEHFKCKRYSLGVDRYPLVRTRKQSH